MKFDTIEKSRIILKLMAIVGLWTNDGDDENGNQRNKRIPKMPPIIYSLLLHLPLTFMYTFLMWLDVFFSSDLNQASEVVYVALSETALLIKILSIWYYGPLAKSMLKEWQANEMFKLKTPQECRIWQGTVKVFGWLSYFYITCSLSVVLCGEIEVLFMKAYKLPFSFWIPFDLEHPVYYWYAYCYSFIASPLTVTSNTALDMFHCYIILHLSVCFKIIALRLENLGGKKFETNKEITQILVEIIEFDEKVKKMSKLCEAIVSYPIFAQILLSAFVMCFSLYRLQNVKFLEDPGTFSALIQYAVVMNLQIFLPCYYANKLTEESSFLLNAVYKSNWMEMSPHNRKLIVIYMHHLQRPLILKAGYFFDIGLPIYSTTMNNAYSFFALLLNMDLE